MSAASKQPSIASLKETLAQAELAEAAAKLALGQALVDALANPARGTKPEQEALDAARQHAEQLRLLLPIMQARQADELEETRKRLDADRQRQLARELKVLLRHAMAFSTGYQNATSAFRRLVAAGAACERLLSDAQRRSGHFPARLSAGGLKAAACQEVNRIGLRPDFEGGTPCTRGRPAAGGTSFRRVPAEPPSPGAGSTPID